MTQIYVVTATVEPEGNVLVETFYDSDEANEFSANGVKPQLRREYGDKMADHPTLSIGYHIRNMHMRVPKPPVFDLDTADKIDEDDGDSQVMIFV